MLNAPFVTSDPEDEAIDALYRGPREAFTEARNVLSRRFAEHGRTAAAERVRMLRKPSVSAWAVNQLWWFHRDAYEALHEAGAQLLALQQRGEAIAGQPANEARRAALDTLRRKASEVLRAAGHATTPATLRKISQSLEASAAGGSFNPSEPLGRLHTELTPPGFGQVARFAPHAADAATAARNEREAEARRAAVELECARTARELTDASAVVRAAEHALTDAEAALLRAQQTADEARATLDRARTRLETATEANARAREALRDAT